MALSSNPPRHGHVLAAAWCLVLLVHAGLLGMWPDASRQPARPGPPAAQRGITVRQIAPPARTAADAQAPGPAAIATRAPIGPLPRAGPTSAPGALAVQAAAVPAAGHAAPEVAGPEPAPSEDPPVYATRLPPPARLLYAMRRGGVTGTTQLDWARDDGRYRLSLQGHLVAAPQAAWISQGLLDAAGVAPERYTENRRGRELRAANFQRDAGRISFSGPGHEFALPAGAQDRLSWLIQLGAVLAANPDLTHPGAEIRVFVVGTRGDGETWLFTVQAQESLDLPGGRVEGAVHLYREPRRPYDTHADIWLDPARHYLPVRLHLRVRATGEGTLLELRDPP